MRGLVFLSLIFLLCLSCHDESLTDKSISFKQPSYFPPILFPDGNEPTQLRFELGRKLFYETALSKSGNQSCASCHRLSAAFTDGQTVSVFNDTEVKRNSPTLANVAWLPYLMSEGGVPSIELQALAPIHEQHEFAGSMKEVIEKLGNEKDYSKLSEVAYGRALDAYVVTRALACFQRGLISGDSKFDRNYFLKSNDFSEEEKRGMTLFFSARTECSSCHALPFFTDHSFYSLGFEDDDIGLERRTYVAADRGKFKTPTLRNIELTGPYMHNGVFSTLEEVVAFYNNGGGRRTTKDERIQSLNLSETEQRELVVFLKTLTDWNFVQNNNFLPREED